MSIEQFQIDFAKLVRKEMPNLPQDAQGMEQLAKLQAAANCYAPFVWLSFLHPELSEYDRAIAEMKVAINTGIQKHWVPVNVRTWKDCGNLLDGILQGVAVADTPAVLDKIDDWLRAGRPA